VWGHVKKEEVVIKSCDNCGIYVNGGYCPGCAGNSFANWVSVKKEESKEMSSDKKRLMRLTKDVLVMELLKTRRIVTNANERIVKLIKEGQRI
jgi:ribosomal protein L44E